MRLIDRVGRRFGRLVVLERAGTRCHDSAWLCRCDCGRDSVVLAGHLRSGNTASCGCTRLRHGSARNGARTREYRSWLAAKERCFYPRNVAYAYYGGRGITMCKRWRESFAAFLADMGPRPAGTSLDRIDVNGNYEPGNCRWATPQEQIANRRRSGRQAEIAA